MAQIGRSNGPVRRVSPLKPSLRGARNWATAQVRAAGYSRKGFWRFAASVFVLFAAIVFVGLWLGGYLSNVRQATDDFTRNRLIAMGFTVERIDVVGEGRLSEADVRTALEIMPGDFLFEADMKAAQARVESLSWVDRAVVRRLWPNRIVVQLIEYQPYALWQHEGELKLISHKGTVIDDADPLAFSHLRLVVGPDAAEHMSEVEHLAAEFPHMTQNASAYVRMASGRWDIHLDHGRTRVKLPADNPEKALRTLSRLQARHKVLDRHPAVIDLRLPDRLTLRPGQSEPA